jgi:PAS domain S-box-containing protein
MKENQKSQRTYRAFQPKASQWITCLTCFLLISALIIKYQLDVKALKTEFIADLQNENALVAEKINNRLGNIHQGMHTFAHLPGMASAIKNKGKFESNYRRVVQEIYNFLQSSIKLTEIYIVPAQFDPSLIDPQTGDYYRPLLKLEIPDNPFDATDSPPQSLQSTNVRILSTDGDDQGLEQYEYLEIQNHLEYFSQHFAKIKDAHVWRHPALLSKEIKTADHDKGFIYSLPVYDSNGNLSGVISSILETTIIKRLLDNGRYLLHSPEYQLNIIPTSDGAWKTSSHWYQSNKPNPALLYSNVTQLNMQDNGNTWYLWAGVTDKEFYNSHNVTSARYYTAIGILVVLLTTLAIMFYISTQTRRRRQVENQNLLLEKTVKQRTFDLRKSEATAKAVLDTAPDGILITDRKGMIITANKAAQTAFKYHEDEITGISISQLIPDFSVYGLRRKSINAGQNLQTRPPTEYQGIKNDGREFGLELTISDFSMNGDQLFTGIFRDITDRKKHESDVKTAKTQAEQASRAKSEFLATMSHELRTPLNAIIGYGEILQDEFIENKDNHYREDLNKILSAGQQLLYLVNSILDLSKIESGKMELYLERFHIMGLIQLAVEAINPSLLKNNNKITIDEACDLEVEADRTKLYQVILNLLSNAIKFTQDGQISVAVSKIDQYGIDWLKITIKDTGIGMNKEQLDSIFKPFTQADSSTTRRYGGTGLGLAISRHFCEMMGGSIGAHSEPDQGTSFTVQLPKEVIGPKADPVKIRFNKSKSASRRLKISRVLVVGDNSQSIDLIERFLTREGFFADGATTVPQALALANQNSPDVIVIDENSLTFDGWNNMVELKRNLCLKNIPIIMLTKSDSKQLAMAMGATDFISKPIQRSALVDIVTKYTRNNSINNQSDNYLLVIDDDEVNRVMMQRILEIEGFAVKVANNGQMGIEQIKQAKPALIFLDIMMPVMNGFEFVEALRDNQEWQDIPVITVTGHDLTDEERNRLHGQVESIISKDNLEPAGLLQKMREVVVGVLRQEQTIEITKRSAS